MYPNPKVLGTSVVGDEGTGDRVKESRESDLGCSSMIPILDRDADGTTI